MTTQTPPERPRVAFQNVGCKLNLYEVEALKTGFDQRGYQVVPFSDQADIYVVNTCTVTGSGDADSRKVVRRARRTNPDATVVATGCYAQRRPQELEEVGAHLVVGNSHKASLLDHLEAHLYGGSVPQNPTGQRPQTTSFLQIEGAVAQGRTRGTLQIQDGCDEHCTYCIIPQVRGPGVSRPAAETLEQARHMVEAGYRELALTGVHSGSYGNDQAKKDGLVLLLQELEKIDGLERIRLNSLEPGSVSDALIHHVAASSKFCRHFHIPLQSGDDQILKRMGRHYTGAYYADRVEKIAALIPDCALGADVMVGFPGERQENFDNTCALIGDLPMTYLHVFPFSLRSDTPAERLKDQQTKQVKQERSRQLIALGERKRLEFHQGFVGRQLQVLVEDRRDKTTGLAVGLSDNYIQVVFEGGQTRPNQFSTVSITRAREDRVFGESHTP
jgi:threonylcarbamoyladenosine tRNA methylthiotransferase MtaB